MNRFTILNYSRLDSRKSRTTCV